MSTSPFSHEFQRLASETHKSYRTLAKEMKLSPPLLARVLNGSRPPTENFVERCVAVFQLFGKDAERLRYLADISQHKISIEPKSVEEAQKIVAFIRELRGETAVVES